MGVRWVCRPFTPAVHTAFSTQLLQTQRATFAHRCITGSTLTSDKKAVTPVLIKFFFFLIVSVWLIMFPSGGCGFTGRSSTVHALVRQNCSFLLYLSVLSSVHHSSPPGGIPDVNTLFK